MPKRLLEQNNSSSDSFNVISGLYRTAEPQEALWQYIPTNMHSVIVWNSCIYLQNDGK